MCGIAGIIDHGGELPLAKTISAMVDRIRHRGPDGQGNHVQENVALGHARLSIIDRDGGQQPMSTPDGQVHLTYNGEVYNFRELRPELEAKGYQFRTVCDTEVVLYAYEAWGKRCVEHFEGMFAFAVADFRKREMFLARDPFGIKPLLYRVDNKSFAFASEFQSLKQLPGWTGEIDLYAIDLYLRYQYIPAPHTAFRKVFKLPAGHRMTLRLGQPYQKIERYWEPNFNCKRNFRGQDDMVDAVDEALRDSVQRHLVADVDFGALLSGGIDSSLVVGYLSELLNNPVKTFSIGFADESVCELEYARQVAQRYGTVHHEEVLKFDALEMLPEIVRFHGEPFGDQSAIPTWAVSKLASSHVPMVLSGDGGDELFAGYSSYAAWKMNVVRHKPSQTTSWRSFVRPVAKRLRPSRYPPTYQPEDDIAHWLPCVGRFAADAREFLWKSELRFTTDLPHTAFANALEDSQGFSDVNRVQSVDMQTFLPEDILCKVDVASMRYGLEVRPPMLDKRFFEVASSIRPGDLYQPSGKFTGKLPLRHVAERKIDQTFAFRPKQGFVLPLQTWLRRDQSNALMIQERLTSTSSHLIQWFDKAAIQETLRVSKPENVWMLLVLDEWCKQAAQTATVANA